jgi:glutamine synthetase
MPSKNNNLQSSLKQRSNTIKNDVKKFLQIRYTDVPGRFLASYISDNNDNFESIFRDGVGLDGSSVQGFADINESDLLLLPDRSTARLIEIMPASSTMVSVIADVYRGFGQGRLPKYPRYVSQTMEGYLAENGLSCQIGAEVECFIFDDIVLKNVADGEQDSKYLPKIISVEQYGTGKYPIRRKSGYNAPPFQDSLTEFRFDVARILKKCYDIDVTNMIHEVASNGQIEINFMHSTLTRAADNVQIYKDVVRNTSKHHNKVSNFMPKPIFDEEKNGSITGGDNGSGMHVSVSFWDNSGNGKGKKKSRKKEDTDNNIFYDKNDDYAEISQTARYFIGGLIEHASSLAAFVTPTVNSYYRMVPDFEAPIYSAWARGNRSAVVRVPVDLKNNFKSKRIEYRAPDPSANPYLAFSAIVAAGLDGIKKKIEPGSPTNENIYKMSDSKRKSLGIKSLPSSLAESLEALKGDSDYLRICFDNELIETYNALKQREITLIGNDKSKARQFMLYYDI